MSWQTGHLTNCLSALRRVMQSRWKKWSEQFLSFPKVVLWPRVQRQMTQVYSEESEAGQKQSRPALIQYFYINQQMEKKQAIKFTPSPTCRVSAKASLAVGLKHAKLCLQQFQEVELQGLAQASERVCKIAAVLQKQKEGKIIKTGVQQLLQQREGRVGLTMKIVVTLRRVKN